MVEPFNLHLLQSTETNICSNIGITNSKSIIYDVDIKKIISEKHPSIYVKYDNGKFSIYVFAIF